jgi:superfamily II DNA or RNA helicase
MRRELYEVQKQHAQRLATVLDQYRAALDLSDTGSGKTLCAAEIASAFDGQTLVIAPKTALPMWRDELRDREVNALGAVNYEWLRTGKTEYGTWADKLKRIWKWNVPKHTLIIWDECQRSGGMNTQNARMMWSAKPYYNLCLSATAAEDVTEMKALGFLLGFHNLKDFWNFCKMHGASEGFFGGLVFSGAQEDIDFLHHMVVPKHGSRLTIADLKDHFKEMQLITTPLDFGDEMQTVYATMTKELAALEARSENDAAAALVIRLRARQKAELLKVPAMVDLCLDLVKQGRSVAIFVNFSATIDALQRLLKLPVGVIDGRNVAGRQGVIDAFQSDKTRIVLVNIQAGGVSISLHDVTGKYPRATIISPSDNAKDASQVLGRCFRAGMKTFVQQHIVFAENTIECNVRDNMLQKLRRIEIFNSGLT